MEVVILAGGKGTRLKPYTAEIPKPLVTVGEYPIIEILLQRLHRQGVTTVHLAVNHLAHLIMATLGDGSRLGLNINYSHEKVPLSTVGPLRLIDNLPDNFLVMNGDVLTDLDVNALYDYHLQQGALVTVTTCKRRERYDYGVLEYNEHNRVVAFQEKPVNELSVSAGIYVFAKKVLNYVPSETAFGFDDLMLTMLQQKLPIASYPFDGFWLDIGRVEDYEQANRDPDILNRLLA